MTTRSIVTSHPDLACDVCARRLLRGEQPDFFIADGRRRLVCELCAPRAMHEGWLRESEAAQDLSLPPQRPRRGRGLFDRLIQRARQPEPDEQVASEPSRRRRRVPYDLFSDERGEALVRDQAPAAARGDAASPDQPAAAPSYLDIAVAAFNDSEYPRRVAGVARSLGDPVVNVRSAEHLDSIVRIVVAWELCWYRYEVDVGEQPVVALAAGQGTDLSELQREECAGNALADRAGAIALAQ